MSRIAAIALNTFREAVRDKILYALLIFALLMIGVSMLVADLAVGEYEKIIKDLGLACINIFGMLIAIFLGIGLVYKEIERKTIYTIASKPVPRWQFLLGKYFGLGLTLATEVAVMGIGFALILWFTGTSEGSQMIPAIWLTFIELMLVTAIAMLFSCFSTPTLSALFTLGLTVISRLTAPLLELAEAGDNPTFQRFAGWLYRLLPDLQTFNIRAEAAYGRAWDWELIAYATGYGLLWCTVLVLFSVVIFQHRDFK
ncbi:MAG: ABC transporter permease subunit [Myxococcota bacterium]|nr:ABC transporter permease subunit [Myxococcota bacterium]